MSRFCEFDIENGTLFVPFQANAAAFERVCDELRTRVPRVVDAAGVGELVLATQTAMHGDGGTPLMLALVTEAVSRLGADGVAELIAALPQMAAAVQSDLVTIDASLLRFVRQGEHVEQRWPRRAVFACISASVFGLWHRASRLQLFLLFGKACQYDAEAAKLRMIVHYLFRVAVMPRDERAAFDAQHVVVSRRNLRALVNDADLDWATSPVVLRASQLSIVNDGGIEDAAGALQADFANRFIGGGVLSGGNVQEEIRFSVSAECLIALLVHEPMGDEETIQIRGTSRFSRYAGYGHTLAFDGDLVDPHGNESVIACMDANDYRRGGAELQFTESRFKRELQKVYTAVHGASADRFATGNFGCGVFLGHAPHKALLQWMACAKAGLHVLYFPFRTRGVEEGLTQIRAALDGATIGRAYEILLEYGEHVRKQGELQPFADFVEDRCNV